MLRFLHHHHMGNGGKIAGTKEGKVGYCSPLASYCEEKEEHI